MQGFVVGDGWAGLQAAWMAQFRDWAEAMAAAHAGVWVSRALRHITTSVPQHGSRATIEMDTPASALNNSCDRA